MLQFKYSFQLFSVLFFLMMSVLGVGSSVALLSTINTVLMDSFPRVRTVFMSAFCCTVGFAVGLIYVTPVCRLGDYHTCEHSQDTRIYTLRKPILHQFYR